MLLVDFSVRPNRTKQLNKRTITEFSTNERVWHNYFLLIAKKSRDSLQCISFFGGTLAYICYMLIWDFSMFYQIFFSPQVTRVSFKYFVSFCRRLSIVISSIFSVTVFFWSNFIIGKYPSYIGFFQSSLIHIYRD